MKHAIIYKISNTINDKVYIGSTKYSLSRRWGQHLGLARVLNPVCEIHIAMKEIGSHNFSIEEVGAVFKEQDRLYLEDVFIVSNNSLVPNGYNSIFAQHYQGARPGVSTKLNSHWSDPVKREKHLIALKNRQFDPMRLALSRIELQKTLDSDEYKAFASKHTKELWITGKLTGSHMKDQWDDPAASAARIQNMIKGNEYRSKQIVSVSTFTGEVRFFDSIAQAHKQKFYRPNINDCFKGKTKTAFGFCWFEKVTDKEQYYKDETIKLMGKFKTEFTVPIIRTCRKTGATKTYANVKEAGLDGFPVKAVNPVLKKTAKTPHFRGFDWDYIKI